MPALAKLIAMPPPIVPAPMTAAVLIGRVGVSSGTSGILAAARSAKNAWRSAFDSGVCISVEERARARPCSPSSNGLQRPPPPPRRTSPARAAACSPRRRRSRANCEEPLGVRVARPSGRAPAAAGRFSATTFAREGDARRPAGRRRRSRRRARVPASFSDSTRSPATIMFERRLERRHPRQPLRAAGARQEAELHLGQRDLRARRGDAVVAAERQLEPAAHRHRVDRGDDRLGRRLDRADHRARASARRPPWAC